MSLVVDDHRDARSRSRSRDRRAREEPPPEAAPATYAHAWVPSYAHPEHGVDDAYTSSRRREPAAPASELPYPSGSVLDSMLPGSPSLYGRDDPRSVYRAASPARDASLSGPEAVPGYTPDGGGGFHNAADDMPGDGLSFLPQKYRHAADGGYAPRARDRKSDRRSRRDRDEDHDLAYGKLPTLKPSRAASPPAHGAYGSHGTYGTYMSASQRSSRYGRDGDGDGDGPTRTRRDSYRDDPRRSSANSLTAEAASRDRDRSRHRRRQRSRDPPRDKSPGPSGLALC